MLCFLLLLLLTSTAQAAAKYTLSNNDNYHFVYLSGSAGYTTLLTNNRAATASGQVGGLCGVGYEFRYNGLYMNVGGQVSFLRSNLELMPYTETHLGYDTQGQETTLSYHIRQTDQMDWNFIDIPMMIGYYNLGFYVGVGVKISYAISPKIQTIGSYDVTANNTSLIGDFHDMPDRGYTTYSIDYQQSVPMRVQTALVGEIGYDLLSSVGSRSAQCHILKLGFYVEYGLTNCLNQEAHPERITIPNPNQATQIIVNPYLSTIGQSGRVVPLYTGVRLTYLIGGSRNARKGTFHRGCMCYGN